MDSKRLLPAGIGILLVITIVNFQRSPASHTIRTVDFLQIWVIGVLSGLLIIDLVRRLKGRNGAS